LQPVLYINSLFSKIVLKVSIKPALYKMDKYFTDRQKTYYLSWKRKTRFKKICVFFCMYNGQMPLQFNHKSTYMHWNLKY